MKTSLLLIALSSSAFAGSPEKPCRSGDSLISREAIDAILNYPSRTASDFIPPVDFSTLGSKSGLYTGTFQSNPNRGIHTNSLDRSLDKSNYTLFNPTPDSLLRDLSPDRPDATESPITVDAGRFSVEMSLFDFRRNRGVESTTWGALNFKAGLNHNTDLQTVFNLYDGTQGGPDGFGDVTLRLKHNLWGNDGGDTALALMPWIKIPTGELSNDEWEGGLIIPLGIDLTKNLGLGLMAEIDYLHNGTRHEFEFLHTAVLGLSLTEKTGAYAEYIGIWKEDSYEAYLAGGMNYSVNEHLLLDFEVQSGLNSHAEDFGIFTGFTKRF
jgi:hypothetical protein